MTQNKIYAMLQALKQQHYSCDDGWYSCPKSPDGCANDEAGSDCTCGVDDVNARIAAVQCEVDRLMLEYCPDEMTPEQVKAWEEAQR